MINMLALLCFAVLVVLFWLIFDAQLEHRKQHYAEDASMPYKLEIKELEEVVRKYPNNFSAWKSLGMKYRQVKNYAKAKESWNKALEIAHTENEATWLKEKIDHIDKHHN